MNKDIAKKWTAALRSGKYPQSRQRLAVRNDDGKMGFCCLGVLCEMAYAEGMIDKKEEPGLGPDEGVVWVYGFSYGGQFSILPLNVMQWAGMKSASGELPDGNSLASLNDHGSTFADIADVIDARAESL